MTSRITALALTTGLTVAGVALTAPSADAATTYPCTWGAGAAVRMTPYGQDYFASDVLNKYSSPQAYAADVAAEWQHELDYGIRLAGSDSYELGSLVADGSLYVRDRKDPTAYWGIITPQLSAITGSNGTVSRTYRVIYRRPTLTCGAATSSASSQGVSAATTLYRVDPSSSTTVAGTKARSVGSPSTYVGSAASYDDLGDAPAGGRGTYFFYAPAKTATLSNGDTVTIPAYTSAKVTLASGWVHRSASASVRSGKVAVPRKAPAKIKRKAAAQRVLTVRVTTGDPVTSATLFRRAPGRKAWQRVGVVRLSAGRGTVRVKRSAATRYRVSVAGYTSPVAGFRPGVDSIYDWTAATSPAVRAR